MKLPSINIIFKEAGITAIKRGERGVVALILKDTIGAGVTNPIPIYSSEDIPDSLSDTSKEQINLALIGYQNAPKKVLAYINSATDYKDAQKYLETVKWDYIAVPDIADADIAAFATWIKGLRDNKDIKVKAVLPNCAADHEGIINFAVQNIKTQNKTYSTKGYCSRIAGLLAGTPLNISATYAPLGEVLDCDHMTKDECNTAIDSGKFILISDGSKVKVGRAINSFVTTTKDKGEDFKKIKIIDIMDQIHDDIKKVADDNYIGKVSNSYDSKCLLTTSIGGYFEELELEELLDKDKNKVSIDLESQKAYLQSIGVDISSMKEIDIKQANTKDKVFLAANIKILDAIEDISFNVSI